MAYENKLAIAGKPYLIVKGGDTPDAVVAMVDARDAGYGKREGPSSDPEKPARLPQLALITAPLRPG